MSEKICCRIDNFEMRKWIIAEMVKFGRDPAGVAKHFTSTDIFVTVTEKGTLGGGQTPSSEARVVDINEFLRVALSPLQEIIMVGGSVVTFNGLEPHTSITVGCTTVPRDVLKKIAKRMNI